MNTFHREYLTGHTAAILEEITAMVCDASRSLKLRQIALFHRIVWQGLIAWATRCDAAHLQLCIPMVLQCLKIACNVLRLKVHHAQDFTVN